MCGVITSMCHVTHTCASRCVLHTATPSCQEYQNKYEKVYGRDESIGVEKRLAQAQYCDQYGPWAVDGVLHEKIFNDKVFAPRSSMAAGREWGTEKASGTNRQKNISLTEYEDKRKLLKSMSGDFAAEPSDTAKTSENLPKVVIDKLESATAVIATMEKQAKTWLTENGHTATGTSMVRSSHVVHTLTTRCAYM